MNLATGALAYWTDHAYDDLLADYPKKKRAKLDPAERLELVGNPLVGDPAISS